MEKENAVAKVEEEDQGAQKEEGKDTMAGSCMCATQVPRNEGGGLSGGGEQIGNENQNRTREKKNHVRGIKGRRRVGGGFDEKRGCSGKDGAEVNKKGGKMEKTEGEWWKQGWWHKKRGKRRANTRLC